MHARNRRRLDVRLGIGDVAPRRSTSRRRASCIANGEQKKRQALQFLACRSAQKASISERTTRRTGPVPRESCATRCPCCPTAGNCLGQNAGLGLYAAAAGELAMRLLGQRPATEMRSGCDLRTRVVIRRKRSAIRYCVCVSASSRLWFCRLPRAPAARQPCDAANGGLERSRSCFGAFLKLALCPCGQVDQLDGVAVAQPLLLSAYQSA